MHIALRTIMSSAFLAFWLTGAAQTTDINGNLTPLSDSVNFFDLQAEMNAYFKDNPEAPGENIWRRREWFLEPRLYPDGEFRNLTKLSMKAYDAYRMTDQYTRSANPVWTFLGPLENGTVTGLGRLNCVEVHPTNDNIIYVGASNGGIWKTTNGGTTWINVTPDIPLLSITDIALDPNNPGVVYALTGDGDPGPSETLIHGQTEVSSIGIIKSTNAGVTWYFTNYSLNHPSGLVPHKLLMHPTQADTQFVAAKNGIWKTTDKWNSWTNVLTASVFDIEFHPVNTQTLYCSGSDWIRKSTDGGDTWALCSDPNFSVMSGASRVELAVTPDFETVVYALAGTWNGTLALYKTILEGINNSWALQDSSTNILGGQTGYNIGMVVKDTDDRDVFAGGVASFRSLNASGTPCCWDSINQNYIVHSDVHDMHYQNGKLYIASDGGLYRSDDDGDTWDDLSTGLGITEIYRIAGTPENEVYYCGTQDNGTLKRNGSTTFTRVTCCDGMTCHIDPTNDNRVYASTQNGNMLRSTDGANSFTNMEVPGDGSAWITPMELDMVVTSVIFVGRDSVYRSDDHGAPGSWIYLGAPSIFDLNCVEQGRSNRNYLYVSSLNSIWKTTNALTNSGPATWTNVSSGLPNQSITGIAIDPDDANNIFVSLSGYTTGNKVFRSTTGGTSGWTNISGSLPNVPVNCIVFHDNESTNNALYIGTDIGVFYRDDNIGDWIYYSNYLPAVNVSDLYINTTYGKIVAGTYGRGLWQADLFDGCQTNLSLGVPMGPETGGKLFYSTSNSISSIQAYKPDIGTEIHYAAGNHIDLQVGFQVRGVAFFEGKIAPCPAPFSEPYLAPWVPTSRYIITNEQAAQLRLIE